jgi:glycerophosphoryl diester phosphodiesterase
MRARGVRRLTTNPPGENSLAAFEYALEHGCDGFEFDVRQTRDGRNVLWHDPEFEGREIAATNYTALNARDGSRLACLEDVLLRFGRRAYLDIELKVSGGEESIVAALRANWPQRDFVLSSFMPECLLGVHGIDGEIPLGFICKRRELMSQWRELPVEVFLPRSDLVRPQLIEAVHWTGRQIFTWTVNATRRMKELSGWGIDGLISDDPAMLYQTFHIE